ncbi:conjugal transfer protein TraI [Mucilaginibacter sp. PAMB04274]|uniref:conjugal transfer protein TraI n=1 Tax=Mucilaginibacter sp. PAMB04274 TaxID=3138568 RepID=UPI0031F6220F
MKTQQLLRNVLNQSINIMKNYMVILPLSAMTLFVTLPKEADAQLAIAEVIKAAITKVIKAVDLQVQRMQNKTIWLQNAQKALENQLSKLKLEEISGWSAKQKELYGQYYDELWKVRSLIAYYERIRHITEKQAALIGEYHQAWGLLRQDRHFSAAELSAMQKVYNGILQESVKNLDEILVIVSAFKTQMTDARRIELINKAADRIDTNCNDLRQYNNQNYILSLQRAQSEHEILTLKKYYGLPE